MKWPEFEPQEKRSMALAIGLCILFGIRYYPSDLGRTFYESFRWIFGFFFYSGALTLFFHGLFRKMFKKTFSLKTGIKLTLWMAVFFSISQSIHEVFFPEYRGAWPDILKVLGFRKK